MDDCRTHLRLRVSPGSANAGLVGRYGDGWKVRVTDPPERGRANEALLQLVARTLGTPASHLELVAGAASRDKVVLVRGLSAPEVDARLAQAAGGGR